MKKKHTKATAAAHHGGHEHAARPKKGAAGAFRAESADAFQVVDEIVALREAVASMQKSPFTAALKAPPAVRRVLEIIENLNLRLAELESGR